MTMPLANPLQLLKYVGLSQLSICVYYDNDIPVYDSDDNNNNFRSKYARNVAGIVLGGVVPVLLCISAIALITMWCKYRKKKTTKLRYQKQYKKNKFKYAIYNCEYIISPTCIIAIQFLKTDNLHFLLNHHKVANISL